MERTGVWARLALLVAVLVLVCSCAQADEAALEILSCEQQGEKVVLDFVCLDENNAPVKLPLQPEKWTVRGAESVTDMQVTDVRRYQGGVHYVFVYEASNMVGGDNMYTQFHCIEAMKACADVLEAGDSMTVVQLGSQMQIILNGESDQEKIKDALGRLKKESKGNTPPIYDQIDEAIGQLKRCEGERTVMLILSTGIDKESKLSKFELAKRLEDARISVYPVLVSAYRNLQNAAGLEALSVRGGYMLQADTAKNKEEMIVRLTAMLPVTREAYTLTARPTDASYNGQSGMMLRVYVRHGDAKISGQVSLTTDDQLHTVIATPIAAVPQVTVTVAPPTPTPTVTATPEVTATPAATSEEEMPQTSIEAVVEAETERDNALIKYALLGGGALIALFSVAFVVLMVTRSMKRAKEKQRAAERPAAAINPQFGAMKAGEAAALKPTDAPVKTEKSAAAATPPAPVQTPQQTTTSNPANFFNTPPIIGGEKPSAMQLVSKQPTWDETMDERQMRQQPTPAAWDQTMDERQPLRAAECDKTMDERQLQATSSIVPQQPAWDKTMDERQAQPVVVQPVMVPVALPAFSVEQTVKAAPMGPQLVLTITDADGIREVAKPLMTGSEMTLGRENTDILLDRHDHSISRNHLSIKLTASNLTVVDHSGNGTMVDGQMLRHGEAKLTIGSELRLGGLDEAALNRITTVIRVKEFRYPGATR